jgi:hypothetical protein
MIKYGKADIIGVIGSSFCLVHCIATPILISVSSVLFANPDIKYVFILIAFGSVYKAAGTVRNLKTGLLLWGSFMGFLFSTLFHEEVHWLHDASVIFSCLLIFGHILNIRQCRACSVDPGN